MTPIPIPEPLRPLLDRPVAILGGGVSGAGARALAGALGARVETYDARGAEFTEEAARGHGLVVQSPGFALGHPWLARADRAGCTRLAELDFGALAWRGRAVAITGTNGKTTLTEFLTHALRAAGRRAWAAGNIGHPLSLLAAGGGGESEGGGGSERGGGGGSAEDMAVVEVSSFQAEALRHFAPEAVLWTNFAEDHLERHAGLGAYFGAKRALAARTPPERLFAGSSVRRFADGFGWSLAGSPRVDTEGLAEDPRLAGSVFAGYPQRENFALAAAWWRGEGLPEAVLFGAARSFSLGRHRLGRVAVVDGTAWWNDSKATNFHAAEAALASFGRPVLLIAGGKPKGGDIAGFALRIAPRVREAFLIGETAGLLEEALRGAGVRCRVQGSLEEAVLAARGAAGPGDDVVLSPGFASFDQFRSYEDRGDRFERAVRSLLAGPAASVSSAAALKT